MPFYIIMRGAKQRKEENNDNCFLFLFFFGVNGKNKLGYQKKGYYITLPIV